MVNTIVAKRTPIRAAFAAWISSVGAYYDFYILGMISTTIFSRVIFEETGPNSLYWLLIFLWVSVFIARPVGALFFSTIGDLVGRRTALLISLLLIGVATFLIAFLPSYNELGIISPLLLVSIRFLQGVVLGGEQAVAGTFAFEHAPDKRRGFCTSFAASGMHVGILLASAVFALLMTMQNDTFMEKGWKIAFYLSALIIAIGIIIRLTLNETPFFKKQKIKIATFPLFYLVRYEWISLICVVFIGIFVVMVPFFSLITMTYSIKVLEMPKEASYLITAMSNIVAIIFVLIWGFISDKIGRKQVFIIGALGTAFLLWPYLWVMHQDNNYLYIALGIVLNGIFYSAVTAVSITLFAEMFSARVRVSGIAIGTQITFILSLKLNDFLKQILDINWVYCAAIISILFIGISVIVMTRKDTAFISTENLDNKNSFASADIFK